MATQTVTFGGVTPYLFYDDAAAMLEWYSRVFGWIETPVAGRERHGAERRDDDRR